jgi:hypothetical protein
VKNVNRIVVQEDSYIATIYFCKSKEDAKALYKIIYNIYLSFMYSGDIYGFNNTYKIKYGLISEPEYYPDSVSGVDQEVWESINNITLKNVYLFGSDLKRSFLFPCIYLPDTYDEFQKDQDYYTPQCFIKGNNVYFGSLKFLDLLS